MNSVSWESEGRCTLKKECLGKAGNDLIIRVLYESKCAKPFSHIITFNYHNHALIRLSCFTNEGTKAQRDGRISTSSLRYSAEIQIYLGVVPSLPSPSRCLWTVPLEVAEQKHR